MIGFTRSHTTFGWLVGALRKQDYQEETTDPRLQGGESILHLTVPTLLCLHLMEWKRHLTTTRLNYKTVIVAIIV